VPLLDYLRVVLACLLALVIPVVVVTIVKHF
jgi:hypothetical protein